MKLVMVAVRDAKADAFEAPLSVPHVGVAMRWFGDQVKDGSTTYGKHPEDYSLWKIGDFSTGDGLVAGVFPPEKLIEAVVLRSAES